MFSYLRLTLQNKILIASFVIFIILYFILSSRNRETANGADSKEKNKPLYADTLIPKGQVLIPIELANVDAVAGLIDQFGIVDLYTGNDGHSVLIASRIKILRAPLNQNQYAVMVAESFSPEMMKNKGPFFAVVQNRFAKDEIQKPEAKSDKKTELKMRPVPPVAKNQAQVNPVEIEYYQGAIR